VLVFSCAIGVTAGVALDAWREKRRLASRQTSPPEEHSEWP